MQDDDAATVLELEANIDFLRNKSRAVGELLDVLIDFKSNIEKYGLDAGLYNAMIDHLGEALLDNETEKSVHERDLERERWILQ